MLIYDSVQAREIYERIAQTCGRSITLDVKNAVNDVDVANGHADVKLVGALDPFWGVDVEDTIKQLRNQKLNTLHLVIDSPGGLFSQGSTLYQELMALRRDGVQVTAEGRGLVASAATLPFAASNRRTLTENTSFLIHNTFMVGLLAGNAKDWKEESRKMIAWMEAGDKALNNIIGNIVGKEYKSKVKDWLAQEKIFDTAEALDVGIADEILTVEDDDVSDKEFDNKSESMNNSKIIDELGSEFKRDAFDFDKMNTQYGGHENAYS